MAVPDIEPGTASSWAGVSTCKIYENSSKRLSCSLMCLHIYVAVVAAQNVNYLFCNLFTYLFIYFRCLKEHFL